MILGLSAIRSPIRTASCFIMMMSAALSSSLHAQDQRVRTLVENGSVKIDLIAEGNGPLVVILPSRGRDSEEFDEIAAGLAEGGFRVLRPQPRGAGASTGPSDNVRMQDLAADVANIIQRENSGPAVIVGHAYGNWVARMTATNHPHLVRGIVLVAAAAKTFPDELRAVVQKSGDVKAPADERLEALRKGFFKRPDLAELWLKGWAPEANRIQGIASTNTKQAEYWSAGTVPFLDLVPDSDPFKPREKWFETKEEFGDRAIVKIISDASHALVPEQPKIIIAEITDWCRMLFAHK